jgi:DNA-binding winged helix-turn-helix (wHTH) protein
VSGSLSEFQTNQPVPIQASSVPRATHPEPTIRTGKLAVNLDTRVVSVDNQPVHLTGKEYAILELLSLRKGTIVTKEMVLDHLYGEMDEPEPKIIDVFVCHLRKKLARATGGNHYIETVGAAAIHFATRRQRRPSRHPAMTPEDRLATAPIDDRLHRCREADVWFGSTTAVLHVRSTPAS